MKRTFRRWMAMLLAVLMVMGTLPTTAWAARIEDDAVPAIPVVDEKDGVVDTLAKSGKDDDVTPINPVDPDPQPGGLSATAITDITINQTAVDSETGVFVSGSTRSATDGDRIVIMILPRFYIEGAQFALTVDYEGWDTNQFTGAFSYPDTNAIIGSYGDLYDFTKDGMPYAFFRAIGPEVVGASVTLDWDGTVKKGNAEVTTQKEGNLDRLKKAYLSEWVADKRLHDMETNELIDPAKGLPFEVFIGGTESEENLAPGQRSFFHKTMTIKVATNPLKVEIVNKQVGVVDTGIGEGMALIDGTAVEYTKIKVINQTDATMNNVKVTLYHGKIELTDPKAAWGNTTVTADQDQAGEDMGMTGDYAESGFTVDLAYGFAEGTSEEYWGSYTIPILAPRGTELISLTAPTHGTTHDVYLITEKESLWEFGVLPLFYNETEYDNENHTPENAWTNYTVEAVCTECEEEKYVDKPSSDNGGIRWALDLSVTPKVQLVDYKGDLIDRTGKKLNSNMVQQTGSVEHTVHIGKSKIDGADTVPLEWVEAEKCYMDPEGKPVPAGTYKVFVDGMEVPDIRVGDNYTKVPCFTVTVADDPVGAAGEDTATAKAKGAYVWNTVEPTGASRVEFEYYAVGATVGLYARGTKDTRGAFKGANGGWTGASVTNDATPSNIGKLRVDGVDAANGRFTIPGTQTSDITITAHYDFVTLNFLTTINGGTVNDTWSTDYIYEIQLLDNKNSPGVIYEWDGATYSIVADKGLTEQTPGVTPWSITVPGNVDSYALVINGVKAKEINPKSLGNEGSVTLAGKEVVINYVIEMASVTPTISGAKSTGDTTLSLPHDKNHDTLGSADNDTGYVAITPTTSPLPKFWYPVGGTVQPEWTVDTEDDPQGLTYAGTSVAYDRDEIKESITVVGGEQELVATFGATGGPAKVEVKKDISQYGGLTVQLMSGNTVKATLPETSTGTGIYSTTENVDLGTYTIRVKNGTKTVDTGIEVEVTGATDPEAQLVQFWTVTVSVVTANTGSAKMTVDVPGNIIDGKDNQETANTYSIVVLDGTKVTWTAGDAAEHYQWHRWDGNDALVNPTNEFANVPIGKDTTKAHTAGFEQIPYTVTFEPEGGNWSGSTTAKTKTVYSGDAVGSLSPDPGDPDRDGYTFVGWFKKNENNAWGDKFESTTTVTSNVTVYAKWQYTITYNTNWTTAMTAVETAPDTPDSFTGTAGGTKTTAPNITTPSYYTLEGWYPNADGTGTKIAVGDAVPEGTKTLYAKWNRETAKITVQFKVNGDPANPGGAQTVTLNDGSPIVLGTGTSDTTVEYTVDQGSTYTIKLDGTSFVHTTKIIAGNIIVPIEFFSLTVTADHTTDSGSKVGQSATGSATANEDEDGPTNYLKDTTVYINAAPSSTLYQFDGWEVVDNKGEAPDPNTTGATITMKEETHLKATFSKPNYNTQLDVLLNGKAKDALDAAPGGDVTEITLTVGTNTYSARNNDIIYDDGHWIAQNVTAVEGDKGTWTVTTLSGDYTVAGKGDMDATGYEIPVMKLYSVDVEEGTYGNKTKAPTIRTHTQATPGPRAIGEAGQSFTLNCQNDDRYTIASPYWDETVENQSKGTTSATSYTLKDAPDGKMVDEDGEGQTLTPVYTYEVIVRTVRGTTPTPPGGTVVVNGKTIDPTSDGVYKVTGLTPGDTKYPITVNGFESSKEIKVTDVEGTGTVDVKLYSVSVAMQTAVTGETIDGKVAIVIGDTTPTTAIPVYLPEGAETDATHKVTVKAEQKATSPNYRLKTETGEHPWTEATYVNDQDATTTTVKTPDGGMADDITITADFVRQYRITAATSGAVTGSDATPTVQTGVGSVSAKVATVDINGVVKVTATKAVEQQINSWAITTGQLYTDSGCSSLMPANYKGDEVYAKATADATVTVTFETRTYDITVTVKKDNVAVEGVTVNLANNTTGAQPTDANGQAFFKMPAKEYTVYTNATGTLSPTDKKVTVNHQTNAGGATVEVNYYTINLVTAVAGTGAANNGNEVKFEKGITSATTPNTSVKRIVFAPTDGGAIDGSVSATPVPYSTTHGDAHYRFDNWSADRGNFSTGANSVNTATAIYHLPAESDLKWAGATAATGEINGTVNQITLTATFVQQYLVEVKNGSTAPSNEFTVKLKKTGDANWASTKSILVDRGGTVTINGATSGGGTESATRVLSEWTLDDNTMGTFDNSTHANATKPADGAVGYVLQEGEYAPDKDSILYLNAWETKTPEAGWVFDKGTGLNTDPKEDTGRARRTTWRNADGQEPSEVRIENAKGNTSLTVPLVITAPADYENTGTDNEYYTILADYLKNNVPIGKYTLNFDYVLGPKDHPNNVNKTAQSTDFIVSSNAYKLTQALVWAKENEPNATANPTASSGRNSVFYRSHTVAAPDIDYDHLEFTWYYADEAPAKANTSFNTASEANDEAQKTKGFHLLGSTAGTNGVGAWSDGTNTIDTGAVAVTAPPDMRGKYIFAVVNVKDTVDTAEGAVITNAIQVDYDAKITVKEDGHEVDNTEKDGYAVYLWPTNGGTFNKSAAIPATYNGASKKFETEGAALNAKTSYNVYVREVEDNDTAAYIMLTGANNVVSVDKQESAEANYYTVTLEAVIEKRVTNFKDNSSPQKEVGETFTSYPDFKAATGNGTDIPTGYAALAGSTVKAKAKDLGLSGDDAGKGWTQDYDLTWVNKATSGADYAPVPNGTTKVQTNKTAVSIGHTHTTGLAGTLYISGSLEQNTYEVKGIVKATDGGKAANPKLKVINGTNTYTFNGSFDANNGGNNSVVTFKVPLSNRTGAINTVYTLSAEPADGSTLKGYCVPIGTAPTTQEPIDLEPVTAAGSEKFTIFIEATVLSVQLNDDDDTDQHKVGPVSDTSRTYRPATHVVRDREGVKVVYNYEPIPKTVTVTNKGNTPLTLTPVIERKTKDDTVFKPITSLTAGADDKGVTFVYTKSAAGNAESVNLTLDADIDAFTLDPEESREITITIPDTLTTYDNMSYHLDFTSVDGRDDIDTEGPTVGYDLKIDIDAVTVGRVTAKEQANGSFKVENNWIKEDVKKPISGIAPGDYTPDKAGETLGDGSSWDQLKTPQDAPGSAVAADNDIQYSWYVADWDAVVTLGDNGPTATGGTITAGQGTVSEDTLTYMPKPEERGMALYLIAKGVNNAQGAAMTPNRALGDIPIPVPFAGYVRVYQDGAQVSSQAEADKYEVYLRDADAGETAALISTTTVADPVNTGKWIHKTADTALFPGHTYEVLVSAAESDTDKHLTTVTGQTVTVGARYARADYYLVTVNETTLSQGKARYNTVLGQYDDSDLFFKTVPQPKPTAVGDLTGDDVTGKHVLKGTKVTFTYDHWDLDYNLNWKNGVSATDTAAAMRADATKNAVQTLTYDQTRAAVNTELVLNLYEVKAYVDGTVGSVSEVTMALTDGAETFTFYAKAADAGDTTTHQVCGLDSALAAADNIEMSQSVSFWLPATKGDNGYNVIGTPSSTNYKLEGYRATHNPGGATTKTLNKTVTANTSLDVVLAGSGSALTVADNVSSTTPPLATNDDREKAQGTASISGTTKSEPTVTQTIELNYHYNATQTIQLTISNTSTDEDGNPGAELKTVTGNFPTSTWLKVQNNGLDNAKTDVPSSGDGSSFTVDLVINDDLDVAGTYTYSPSFTFTNEEGTSATVTYTLKVIVNPLPITSLTIEKDDATGKLQLTAYDATTNPPSGGVWVDDDNDGTNADVSMDTLTWDDNDIKYVWVEAPLGRTVTKSDLIMTEDAGGNTITATAAAASAGVTVLDTQTSTSYTPAKQGVNYQLVAYRGNSTSNAKGFAVSNAVTTTYEGIVYVNVDGARKGETNNAPDPGYKVEFYDGATKVADGEWRSVDTNKYAYVSKTGLTPGKEYTVKVSRSTTDVESTVAVDLAKKLTGTDIGTALTNSNVTEVSYFTVHADNFVPQHYKDGITGDTLPAIAPKISLDTLNVTNKTVLSSQSVTAKVETAWTQDYDLTWQQDNVDQGAAVTAGDAVTNGYTPANAITAETHIGGRLVQNTYDVLGNIQNLTGDSGGSVKKVELTFNVTGDTRSFMLTTDAADSAANHIHDNNSIVNDNSDTVTGNVGDYITVRVVKGTYDIVAFDGLNTTIQSVRIGGGNDPVVTSELDLDDTRNKETLTGVAGKNREFTVYVAARDMQLGVTDDEKPTANDALSKGVTGNDANQHADNAEVHYVNATSGTFDLTLSNPGNTDLAVTAKVFRFEPTDTIPDYATGTWTGEKIIASDHSYTDADVLKITNILEDGTWVNARDTAIPAGTVTLDAKANNADDAIYVVRFTSTYTDTNGTDNGPIVYYVLDLTVDPLPIVEVGAEAESDGTLQLTDNDLDSVKVSPDGDTADTTKFVEAATIAELDDDDISFVWAVSERDDLTKDDFALDPTTNRITSDEADVDGTNSKTRTPIAAEQGKYFYLIAYRKDANSNADDFAVSAALYAQVTIFLETRRYSDKSSTVPDTSVQITGTYGTGETATRAKSNTEKLVVPFANDPIAFTADLTDVTHKDTTNTPPVDVPNNAEYYFMGWGPEDDDRVAVDGTDRLSMTYTATKQDTVIGYYDWLPSLTGASACTIGSAAIPEKDRTFTYDPRDGSRSVRIEVKPAPGSYFRATGVEGEDLIKARPLNATAFEMIADETSGGTIGGYGKYILTNSWILANLEGDQDYVITFFDLVKGVENKGYEGYDKSKAYVTSTGDKNVVAVVADANKGQGHTVQVTNGGVSGGTPGETSNANTVNGVVTIHANPHGGYKFTGWETIAGTGRFLEDGGEAIAETTFRPTSVDATVQASFAAADFTPTEGHAKVYYGDNEFYNKNGGDLVQVGTKDPEVSTMEYGYVLLSTEEAKAHLGVETLPVNVYTADGVGEGTNITNKKPDWLLFKEDDGTFDVDHNGMAKGVHVRKDANGDDVTDELKLFVKITSNGNLSKIVPFTVDVMTAELEVEDPISAANYFAAYVAAKGKDVINHGDPIELDYFTYTSVRSVQNNADTVDNGPNAGNGTAEAPIDHDGSKWTVSFPTFNGTGPDPALTENANDYTFTFTYKPDTDEVESAEKWDYKPAKVTLKITVQKPPQSIQFADTITNYADVTVGRGDDYSAFGKDEVPTQAPEAMAYATNTWRQNETITYLDTEPLYEVKFQAIGTIYGAKWTIVDDKMEGFEVAEGSDMPTYDDTMIKDVTPSFVLKLAPKSEDIPEGYEGDLWTGVHHVKFMVSGFVDEDKTVAITPATYELTVTVLPRTITALNVTVTDGQQPKPEDVKPTIEGNPHMNEDGKDDKGNTPVKASTATWGPDDGHDGKHTEVTVTVEIDPNYKYAPEGEIEPNTDLTVKEEVPPDGTLNTRFTPDPEVERNNDRLVTITQKIPYLMHDDVKVDDPTNTTGPRVDDRRTVSVLQGATDLGSYTIDLGAYGSDVYGVQWTIAPETIYKPLVGEDGIGAVLGELPTGFDLTVDGEKQTVTLDLSAADTSKPGTYALTLNAVGKANPDDPDDALIPSTYVFQLTIRPNNPPPPPDTCPCKVFYHIGSHGVTSDPTVEDVKENARPSKVPAVAPVDGYIFRGWSQTNPATLKDGEQPVLVDPKTVTAKGETMTFYAVIQKTPYHEHYIIGYPNGNFAPGADINRAAVATIIARAILPDFVEGADYGNPGGYSDVSGHWAESAIAYCSKFGVFEGLPDGTFQPNRSITRQEFALVIARLDGVMNAGEMDFTDIGSAGTWALGGIYTAYVKGWVNGYPDGSFKPLNNISRAEAVKVFNAYLKRGVDADGLRDLHEYVYPDKNTGNDFDQYRTWPDVPATYWAYYDIIEASNDHAYEANMDGTYSVPEKWAKCWIDERWGGKTVSADAAMVSAGFQVWLH